LEVLYIGASQDEFYTPERLAQFADAMRQRARSVELQMFDCGHEVPRDSYPTINQWIKSKVRNG
jgi:predicted esterase